MKIEHSTPEDLPKHSTEILMAEVKKAQLGQLMPKPGQKLWSLDLEKEWMEEVELEEVPVLQADGTTKVQKSVTVKRNHLYALAFNIEGADRKFRQMLGLKPRPRIKKKKQKRRKGGR